MGIMSEKKTVVPPTPRYAIGNRGAFFKRPPLESVQGKVDAIIFGCPFDAGCSYRVGARFGPQGVRQASQLMQYSYHAFHQRNMSEKVVCDGGDVPCTPYDVKKALGQIEEYADELRTRSDRLLCVGGDHTISYGLLASAAKLCKAGVCLIHFDTHLDTSESYFGERFTHGTPFRRAVEDGHIDGTHSFHVGCHGSLYSKDVLTSDANLGFTVITSEEFVERGWKSVAEEIKLKIGNRPAYISIDIDVLDPAFAPGTGTPEAGGLQSRELIAAVRALNGLNCVGGDVVEVAPCYDHAEITSLAATSAAYEVLSVMI